MKVKTVPITFLSDGTVANINESDFDPTKHLLATGKKASAPVLEKKAAPPAKAPEKAPEKSVESKKPEGKK